MRSCRTLAFVGPCAWAAGACLGPGKGSKGKLLVVCPLLALPGKGLPCDNRLLL